MCSEPIGGRSEDTFVKRVQHLNLTSVDVQKIIDDRLIAAGLSDVLSKEHEQFLGFAEGFFVELVLRDANRLAEIEVVLQSIKTDLQKQGARLEVIVRPIWEVVSIKYQGVLKGADHTRHSGLRFSVDLVSGSRACKVSVDITMAALDVLRTKLNKDVDFLTLEWSPEKGDLDEGTISLMVDSFLKESLSAGGTGFWDPIRHPTQELGSEAMSGLLGESRAFEDLRQLIDDALEPPLLSNFLKDLASRQTKINRFDEVLPHLSSLLGGPYQGGEVFSTSSSELFSRLRQAEKRLLANYYSKKVDALLARFPYVKNEFPQLFG